MIPAVHKTDDENAYPWMDIFISFNELGQISHRETYFDDGRHRIEEFEAGTISVRHDNDFGDSYEGYYEYAEQTNYPWEYIRTEYDYEGLVESRETYFDDGRYRQEEYEDGIISVRTDEDFGGPFEGAAYAWEYMRTEYDVEGLIAFRETFFDDGRYSTEDYESGTLTSRNLTDEDDAYAWLSMNATFNSEGEIATRETEFDDGRYRFEEYDTGTLAFRSTSDNEDAYNWQEVRVEYDDNGLIKSRQTDFDDGRVRNEEFEAGVLASKTESDYEDTKNWDTKSTFYDESGNIQMRNVSYDNGRFLLELYEDGALVNFAKAMMDMEEEFDWLAILRTFESDGTQIDKLTLFDTGDFRLDVLASGATYEFDGDGSDDWEYRATEYSAEGEKIVTEYTDGSYPAALDDFLLLG